MWGLSGNPHELEPEVSEFMSLPQEHLDEEAEFELGKWSWEEVLKAEWDAQLRFINSLVDILRRV